MDESLGSWRCQRRSAQSIECLDLRVLYFSDVIHPPFVVLRADPPTGSFGGNIAYLAVDLYLPIFQNTSNKLRSRGTGPNPKQGDTGA